MNPEVMTGHLYQSKIEKRFFELVDKGYSTRKARRQVQRELKRGKRFY